MMSQERQTEGWGGGEREKKGNYKTLIVVI